jgi:PKD repeat protein
MIMANPQLPVSYQFDLTVAPTDLEGNPVADALTWTNSDTTGATTLTVDDATTLKVTVGAPVLATPVSPLPTDVVITATDALGNVVSYTFDVVADVATKLAVSAAAPVKITA